MCVHTQQALDILGALAWTGAGEKARGETRGGGGRSGWDSTAAGSAQRTAGGGATSRILQNSMMVFNLSENNQVFTSATCILTPDGEIIQGNQTLYLC